MKSDKYMGGCHCGNIVLVMALTDRPEAYQPRACDCDFCRAHAASYISDPHGKLKIRFKDGSNPGKYRQGSGIADCLVCKTIHDIAGKRERLTAGDALYHILNGRSLYPNKVELAKYLENIGGRSVVIYSLY